MLQRILFRLILITPRIFGAHTSYHADCDVASHIKPRGREDPENREHSDKANVYPVSKKSALFGSPFKGDKFGSVEIRGADNEEETDLSSNEP